MYRLRTIALFAVLNGTAAGSVSSSIGAALSSTTSSVKCGSLTAASTVSTPAISLNGADLSGSLAGLQSSIASNNNAIGVLNGSGTTSGSVSSSIGAALSSTSSSVKCGSLSASSIVSTPAVSLSGVDLGATLTSHQNGISSNTGMITSNTNAINVLNGSSTTSGSVSNSIGAALSSTSSSISCGSLTTASKVTTPNLTINGGTADFTASGAKFSQLTLSGGGQAVLNDTSEFDVYDKNQVRLFCVSSGNAGPYGECIRRMSRWMVVWAT